MEKQHLTYFKIENFKRFDSFEMSNLGQFNLIVGDNNVGKTSVLESLLFDPDVEGAVLRFLFSNSLRGGEWPDNFEKAFQDFSQLDAWQAIFKYITKPIVISILKEVESFRYNLEYKHTDQLNAEDRAYIQKLPIRIMPKAWIKLTKDIESVKPVLMPAYLEGLSWNRGNDNSLVHFISANQGYSNDLVDFYYRYINSDKRSRREINKELKRFIPDFEEVSVHKYPNGLEVLGVFLVNSNTIYPITRYGDGSVRITRILFEIVIAQGKRLMIDEIGSGVHFLRLKEFWKIVLLFCYNYEVQLFATTHSLECQQAFIEALQDEDMQQYQKDARNITMVEDKNGQVKAVTYDFEQFEYALNIGFNTRGGKL